MPKNPWDAPPKTETKSPGASAWPPKDDAGRRAWVDDDAKRATRLSVSRETGARVANKYKDLLRSTFVVDEDGSAHIAKSSSREELLADAKTLGITEDDLANQAEWKNNKIRGESEGGEIPAWVDFSDEELIRDIINEQLAGEHMAEEEKAAMRFEQISKGPAMISEADREDIIRLLIGEYHIEAPTSENITWQVVEHVWAKLGLHAEGDDEGAKRQLAKELLELKY